MFSADDETAYRFMKNQAQVVFIALEWVLHSVLKSVKR